MDRSPPDDPLAGAGRQRRHLDLAVASNEAGCIELATGDSASALVDFTRRHRLLEAIAEAAPDDLDDQHERFMSALQLVDALSSNGQAVQAIAEIRATRVAAAAVLAHHPGDDAATRTLAWADAQLARGREAAPLATDQAGR